MYSGAGSSLKISGENHMLGESLPPSLARGSPLEPDASKKTKTTFRNTLLALEKAVDRLHIPGLKDIVQSLQHLDTNLQDLEDAIARLSAGQDQGISPELEVRIDQLTSELFVLINDWWKQKATYKITYQLIDYEDHARAVNDMNGRIKKSLDAFLLDSQISRTIVAGDAQRPATRMKRHSISKELQTLPRANATYSSFSRNNAPTCFTGTRQSVLDDFHRWFNTGSAFIYILFGIAGVGKSTIAQTIAALMAGKDQLAASFFFSRYESEHSTSRTVFSSLAFQLAQHNEEFATRISKALQASPDAAQQTLSQQLEILIVEPLKDVPSSTQPVLVILDGLDECEEKGATDILRLLSTRLAPLPFIKVFITTRPEPHIKRTLEQTKALEWLVLHDIEACTVSEDIRRFLTYQLSTEAVEEVLPGCGWSCEAKDIDALVQSAGQLFIIASISEKFIKDEKQRNPKRQLKLLLSQAAQPEGTKRSVFATLDRLYLQVLESAVPVGHHNDDTERFQNVVGTVVTLQDPLLLNSLAQLLVMDVLDVKAVLDLLQSVIVQSDGDPRPRIYHPSFPDFITNPKRCKETRFLIDMPQHHARLAGLCLDLMGRLLRRNICHLGIPDQYMKNESIPELRAKIKTHISPELVYACSFWAVHLNECLPGGEEVLEKVYQFAFKHLLFWLEVLSLAGRMEAAYLAVQHAQRFSTHHGAPPELLALLEDARRFIVGSQEIIRLSALHVYYSALPFSPSESLLWQAYENEARSSMRVLGGREREWDPLLAVLSGHSGDVTCIALSPDGTRLASGSSDKTARLWDAEKGALLLKLEDHTGGVTSVAFSPNCSRLASASEDTMVRLWDATTGALLFKFGGHSGSVISVAFSPDNNHLASGSSDKTVRLWHATTGASISKLEGHSHSVNSVAFSSDSSWLASGSSDKTSRLWKVATGMSLFSLKGHKGWVKSVSFSPSGNRLASASDDATVRLWDTATGASLFKLKGHSSAINSVAFSPDGSRLATASKDNTVRFWDAVTGVSLFQLKGHSGSVTSVTFFPDGNHLASASADKTVRLWATTTKPLLSKLEGHSRSVNSVVFSPDGSQLASASHDETVLLWDAVTGAPTLKLKGHSRSIISVTFSPDGNRLASASNDKTVRLWDTITGTSLFTLKGHSWQVNSVAFSPDNTRLASGSNDKTIRLWNASLGTLLLKLQGHSSSVTSVVFSSNGSLVASASNDKTVRLWDAAAGVTLFTFEGYSWPIGSVAFSSDGKRLASGFSNDIVRLWDATAGALITQYPGSLHFTPDGLAYISQPSHFQQLSWYPDAPQPTLQADISDLPEAAPLPDLSPTLLTLLRDSQTQSYAVCAPSSREAARVPICWLPFGFVHVKYAWNGKIMGVGSSNNHVMLLDTTAIQFE